MEIRITSQYILKVLYVLSWIIFIGVSIEAGGFLVNAFFALFSGPDVVDRLWKEVDLTNLYNYDPGYFFVQMLLMSIVAVLRCILFYLIVRVLHKQGFDVSRPFNEGMKRFIQSIAYLALGIGLFSHMGANYAEWFEKQGVDMPDLQYMRLAGADVWAFMGIILLVIAQIFKRGIEIQKENELTI